MANLERYVSHFVRPNSHQMTEDGETFRRNILLLNGDVLPGAPYFTITNTSASPVLTQMTPRT